MIYFILNESLSIVQQLMMSPSQDDLSRKKNDNSSFDHKMWSYGMIYIWQFALKYPNDVNMMCVLLNMHMPSLGCNLSSDQSRSQDIPCVVYSCWDKQDCQVSNKPYYVLIIQTNEHQENANIMLRMSQDINLYIWSECKLLWCHYIWQYQQRCYVG